MKHISESFKNSLSIAQMVEQNHIDEGLKDVFNSIKAKFKKAWEYLKGFVIKAGSYFIPVKEDGEMMNCISPLTSGQAYKDGLINKSNTFVCLDKIGSRIVGLKTDLKQAQELYGSGNSIKYWQKIIKECAENSDKSINEVKLHTEDPEAKYNIICDNDMLKTHIKMVLKNKRLARLMIWGAPGIGKTAILNTVLEEMKTEFPDYSLIVKTLSNETPDNFTLPKYVEVNGQEKAADIPKTWLPVYNPTGDPEEDAKADEACGKGLLFVDELSRATPQVLNVILPLVNEGVFNGYQLGSGWTIICASNRAEDEMSGQADIGNALANRFKQVYYEPTVNTWRKWADKQNFISPLLLQWLSMPESENMSGGKFFYMDPNEDMDNAGATKLMCTPRSWTNAMRELAEYSNTGTLEGFTIFDIPRDVLAMTLNSYVPASAVDAFLSFLEVISKIGDFDAAVYDVWNNGGKNLKIDKKNLLLIMLPISQLICSAHSDKLPTTEEFVNLANWVKDQNSSSLASYVLDVFKNIFVGDALQQQDLLFIVHAKIKRDPDMAGPIKSHFKKFTDKWGVKFEELPDYMDGLKILQKKYGNDFAAASIGGIDLLG